MPRKEFAGAAPATTLNGDITNVATSLVVADGTGYPTGSVGPFVIVIDRGNGLEEKILCTARTTNTFTLGTRGYDSTSANAHTTGAVIRHVIDSITVNEANAHVNDDALDDHSQYMLASGTRHDLTARHAVGAVVPSATPTIVLGTAGAAGSATTTIRSDATIVAFDASAPSTQAFGDAAAVGSIAFAARRDHKHAMPTDPVTAHVAAGDPHTVYPLAAGTETIAGAWTFNNNVLATGYIQGASGGVGEAFKVGNDVSLVDVNVANTLSLQGQQDATLAVIRFGTTGPTLNNSSTTALAASGTLTGTALIASGLTGAVAASRYVGATATGAPVSGTFAIGDYIVAQNGKFWVCTVAGSPGTFVEVGSAPAYATPAFVLGTAYAAGAAATVVRSDATLAVFDATSPSTQAFGDSAVVGSIAFAARRDHKHAMPANPVAYATPGVVLGSAAAAGSAATLIRSDSTIAAFDATSPSTQAFGDTAVVGTIAFAARRDHKHAMPANPVAYAAPAFTLTTSNATGAAATLIRSDASLAIFDATVPSTASFGASAATGSIAFAARRDHVHGMPANPVTAHESAGDPHTVYPLAAGTETIGGAWSFTSTTKTGVGAVGAAGTYLQASGDASLVVLEALGTPASVSLDLKPKGGSGFVNVRGAGFVVTDAGGTSEYFSVGSGATATSKTFSALGDSGLGTLASKWAGSKTTGAPTTGFHSAGDFVTSQDGTVWVCITTGSPGTWKAQVRGNFNFYSQAADPGGIDGDFWYDTDDVSNAHAHDNLPRGVLGYAQVTAGQASITSEVDVTGLSVTVTVGASRRIKVTAYGLVYTTVANDWAIVRVKEGTTQLRSLGAVTMPTASRPETFGGSVVLTPSAGAHTYKLTALRASGSGSITFDAASTDPAFILVEDIGPV
jgi:hypothetical protein